MLGCGSFGLTNMHDAFGDSLPINEVESSGELMIIIGKPMMPTAAACLISKTDWFAVRRKIVLFYLSGLD